jgi:5-enolpyruvylshikimate-3-phosphate synthase
MALKCKGKTTINNAKAINKSFPEFYNLLDKIFDFPQI